MKWVSYVIVLMLVAAMSTQAEAARKVYWGRYTGSNYTAVRRCNTTGTNRESYDVIAEDVIFAPHIDWLNWNYTVFIAARSTGAIGWVFSYGGFYSTTWVKESGPRIDAIVLRPGSNEELFYATQELLNGSLAFGIRRIQLDGSGDTLIFQASSPVGDMQFAGNRVWWTDNTGLHTVSRTGTNYTTVISDNMFNVGFDVDTGAGLIFYSQLTDNTLWKANIDGSDRDWYFACNASQPPGCIGYPRVDYDGRVYWVNLVDDQVKWCVYDGFPEIGVIPDAGASYLNNALAIEYGPSYCERATRFGDLVAPSGTVDFRDIARVVAAFLDNVQGWEWDACDLSPCVSILGEQQCVGDGVVDFKDIALEVAVFRGVATCD